MLTNMISLAHQGTKIYKENKMQQQCFTYFILISCADPQVDFFFFGVMGIIYWSITKK
jgi:hypothetical protein